MTRPALLGRARDAWAWFVAGLAEALLWAGRRGRSQAPFRLVVGDDEGVLFGPDGGRLGRLGAEGSTAGFDPPGLAQRLAGQVLDVEVPSPWMVRRQLEPVAAQSRPFLDAFVRHRIERVTPWRADAVHHRILADPMEGDPSRLAVAVVLVPKRLVERWLAPLAGLGLAGLCLRSVGPGGAAIPIGRAEPPGLARLRRGVAYGLAGLALATVSLCAILEWQAGVVATDLEEQNRVLDERKVVLAKARRREGAGDEQSTKLLKLRDARPSAVAVIDALADALPDSAHLSALGIEGDKVSISGVSTDPSALVPALETSGRFADVATSAATTRTERGDADSFALTMRAVPQAGSPAVRKAGP